MPRHWRRGSTRFVQGRDHARGVEGDFGPTSDLRAVGLLVRSALLFLLTRYVSKSAGGAPPSPDLVRVWGYRGEIFQLTGRASRRPDRLDLTPPGGWLPTYASL